MTASARQPEVRVLVFIVWILSVVCLSLPGRLAPMDMAALDPVALIKLASRLLSIGMLSVILLRHHQDPRLYGLLLKSAPLILFAFWAAASALWSPMQAVSLGHSVDLVLLLLLLICSGLVTIGDEQRRVLFRAVALSSSLLAGFMVVMDLPAIASGGRPASFLHPNELGSISGVGLVVLLFSRYLWSWPWTRTWFLPCGVALISGMYAARSRTALIATFAIVVLIFWKFRRSYLFVAVLVGAGSLFALSPYVDQVGAIPENVGSYFMRGSSAQDMMGGSGRDELWALALAGFKEAPLFGHGYYVMSSTGVLNVWGKTQWQTAHNLTLHALTGTGLIGLALLYMGLISVSYPSLMRCFRGGPMLWKSDYTALLLLGWTMIVGLFEVSFLGPIDPINVSLFCALGVACAS